MKKGFTLIELLAVIVIVAIILVVAVPRIMKAIDSSKVNAYISNEKLVLKSAELYVSKNIDSLPVNVGDTSEILLSSLITDGYIKDIKSPFNKNNSCSGYVLITKKNIDEYDYTPHINCFDNTMVSSTQDKLLLHYKFDDFQESTQNLFTNRNMMIWGFDASGYSNRGTRVLQQDGSVLFENIDSNSRVTMNTTISALTDYTVSVKYKKVTGTPTFRWQIQCQNGGTSILQFWTQGLQNYVKDIDGWQDLSFTFNCPSLTTNALIFFQTGADYASYNNAFLLSNPQLEKKSYRTPFVDGERTGTVKDYSANNNHSTLILTNTPKWVFDEERSEGVYKFNGINNYIRTNAKITSKSFTISAWINVNNYNTVESWIVEQYADAQSQGRTIFGLMSDGTLRVFMNSLPVYGPIIQKNKWYHVVGGRKEDGTGFLYTNGILSATGNLSTVDVYDVPISIGARVNNNVNYFDGLIDDIRIYNRSLTEDEVRLLYESTK